MSLMVCESMMSTLISTDSLKTFDLLQLGEQENKHPSVLAKLTLYNNLCLYASYLSEL